MRRTTSLRSRVLAFGLGAMVLMISGFGTIFLVGQSASRELREVTENVREEQEIANRIANALMRQIATASALPLAVAEGSDEVRALEAEFRETGEEVYALTRAYLFRSLGPAERLRIEEIAEEHQRLEVVAARRSDLLLRGLFVQAAAEREAMFSHVLALLEGIDRFLSMREDRLTALQARQEEILGFLSWAAGFVALLIGGGAVILAVNVNRRVTLPLEELVEASARIERGELSTRVKGEWDGEFEALADRFNRMAAGLERSQGDLERRNEELAELLETVRSTQTELVQAEKLSAMGRMTAGFAHELNNPLASVLGFAQLLQRRLEEEGAAGVQGAGELDREYLRPILEEATRAQQLVRTFLRFSRRSGDELSGVSVRDAVEVVRGLREYAFAQAGLALEVGPIPDRTVLAEEQTLQGIVLNLVNNAFDAMAAGSAGSLRIEGRLDDGHLELAFEDDGPGFEDPEQALEPFYTTKPVGEGTGLGLALAHRFMTSFGGGIRLEDRSGGGAGVILRFVLAGAAGEREPAPPETAPDVAELPDAGSPSEVATILIVEDEAPLRALQERILARLGLEAVAVGDTAAAKRLLGTRSFDAIVSDVRLPGEDGLELFRWVEESHPELASRFLFVTGDLSLPDLERMAEDRPDRFLLKPFGLDEYEKKVRAVLRSRPAGSGSGV